MLIMDLGMNNGDDTDYYLKLGYDVVAVEANPVLIHAAEKRFKRFVKNGTLKLCNFAISSESGALEFYINLENSHWSSLHKSWAERNKCKTRTVSVKATTLNELFMMHGVPYFMKIDIEGSDLEALRQLEREATVPEFISVEDCYQGYEYLRVLEKIGYQRFALSDQSKINTTKSDARNHSFRVGSSGPFGEFLMSKWYSLDTFLEVYRVNVRGADLKRIAPLPTWWDIHASLK